MRTSGIVLLAAVALAGPLRAQTVYNPAVAKAMAGHWQRALCPLKGDFRSASAATYLAYTDTARDDQRKMALVKNAVKVTTEAITGGFPTVASWYFLGRADLMLGDIRGADTAFTKAEALSPDCAAEIKGFRQIAWNVLVIPSAELMKRNQFDSARITLELANTISRDYPQGFFNLGVDFVDLKQYDSAAFYFKLAQEKSAKETRFATTGDDATANLAFLYQQMGRHADAIVEFRKILAVRPNDAEAKKALALSLRLTGDTVGASQLQQQLATSGDLSAGELMNLGIEAYKVKDYPKAIEYFQKVLDKEPGSHDALFNIANMYFAMGDGAKLVDAAKQCLAVSPLGEDDMKLIAQGYRILKNEPEMLKYYGQLTSLITAVSVTRMTPGSAGVKLTGTAVGREGQDAKGNTLSPAAITLVFEFTDAKGALVTSQEVAIPALQPSAKFDINIDAAGAGIVSWRYHVK